MALVNVIIVIEKGIITDTIVCKCSTRAGCIYVDEAKKLGVVFNDDEEVEQIGYSDTALCNIIDEATKQLESTGNQIHWNETELLKKLK